MGPLAEKTCAAVKELLDLQIIDQSKKLDLLVYGIKKVKCVYISGKIFISVITFNLEKKIHRSIRNRLSKTGEQGREKGADEESRWTCEKSKLYAAASKNDEKIPSVV